MILLRILLVAAATVAILIVVARLLLPLPDISARKPEHAIALDRLSMLGKHAAAANDAHEGLSGVIALAGGHDAFASRLALARMAERSIDAQYYIWHDDVAGRLLLKELYEAALRGVRVRLLLDDNGVPGLDSTMAALNAVPNFEIRLFNPSTVRNPKFLGYTFDFLRMNRRMHNKSFIVDGAAAIIGGRNIGNEYFQVGDQNHYLDMDVLGLGVIVPQTASVFDEYWNSASVFEVERIVAGQGDLAAFLQGVREAVAREDARRLAGDIVSSAERFRQGGVQPEWTVVKVVADDPVKGEGKARDDQLMISRLAGILGPVKSGLDVVSAYFVPGARGFELFAQLAEAGAKVRILTNAMNTTDVLVVHAGYTKYRRDLLKAGVELFELKDKIGGEAEKDALNPLGFSSAALHAKTFAVDGKRIFIGSFNFDPRSAHLNCEMGFVIDSQALASSITNSFDGPLALVSYRPELTPTGQMVWTEKLSDGRTQIYQQEPGASWAKQVAIVLIGLLPVEWLL